MKSTAPANTAQRLVVDTGKGDTCVTLRTPRTIGELWQLFTQHGTRPTAIYLVGNVARVSF